MSSFIGFLEGIEKLAYKILLWLIFIPKTIVQVTINPAWAPEYVKGELKQENSPFDEYISPVVLLLVVALLPALVFGFLPEAGSAITNLALEQEIVDSLEDPVHKNRLIKFEATTTFVSSSSMEYVHSWFVEKEVLDEAGQWELWEIYRVNYRSSEYPVEYDSHTTKDTFYYLFDKPGNYYVNVHVDKIDPESRIPVEYHDAYLSVTVPEDPEKPIVFSSTITSPSGNQREGTFIDSLSSVIKKETTVLLALALLIPPLLLALFTKLSTSEEISENSLRESFYTQCYYLSPLSLAIWATYYAGYFYTSEIFFFSDTAVFIVLLPFLLAAIWFMGVETQFLARERKTSESRAFFILLLSILVIGALLGFGVFFPSLEDMFRITAIWAYPLASLGLLALIIIAWLKRKRSEARRLAAGEIILASMLFISFGCIFGILALGDKIPPSVLTEEVDLGNDPTGFYLVQPQDEPTPTEPPAPTIPANSATPELQMFYTEEFDGNLDSWIPYTAIGEESQVIMNAAEGRLVFHLTPVDGNVPTHYLYNADFIYTDVQLDIVSTNNGNNANAVILLCRLTDSGWYEFNFSNSGEYVIYAVDATGTYNELSSGTSPFIKSGFSTNRFTGVCKGSELSLYVNGELVDTVLETTFNLHDGNIGIGVSAFQALPIDVTIDSLTVSRPE